jgi:hypothetical protein
MRIMWKDNRKADQLENLGFNWSQTPCQWSKQEAVFMYIMFSCPFRIFLVLCIS